MADGPKDFPAVIAIENEFNLAEGSQGPVYYPS